jgi:aspartate-semialdehyde dehydrogenase
MEMSDPVPTPGPYITDAEREELRVHLGRVVDADFPISVSVNRVSVRDGHTESVFLKLKRKAPLAEIRAALEAFTGEPQRLRLPSAPPRPRSWR